LPICSRLDASCQITRSGLDVQGERGEGSIERGASGTDTSNPLLELSRLTFRLEMHFSDNNVFLFLIPFLHVFPRRPSPSSSPPLRSAFAIPRSTRRGHTSASWGGNGKEGERVRMIKTRREKKRRGEKKEGIEAHHHITSHATYPPHFPLPPPSPANFVRSTSSSSSSTKYGGDPGSVGGQQVRTCARARVCVCVWVGGWM
jgi:hypothetical protein